MTTATERRQALFGIPVLDSVSLQGVMAANDSMVVGAEAGS